MARDLSIMHRLRIAGRLALIWLECLVLRARVASVARRG
jgi:hypothetical protein